MKNKRIIYLTLISVLYLVIIFICTRNGFYFLSDNTLKDINIIDSFRNIIWHNNFNIDSFLLSLNIFKSSLVLNPFIVISYLLPFVTMKTYILISSTLVTILSIYLIDYIMHKYKYSDLSSMIVIITYLFSSTFINNYNSVGNTFIVPFILLGFLGVNRVVEKRKIDLLVLSILLLVLSSYKLCVSALMMILIYSIYVYLKSRVTTTFSQLMKYLSNILIPIIIGVFILSFIGINVIYNKNITFNNFKYLFKINFYFNHLFYDNKFLCLNIISVLSMSYALISNKKENIFLGIISILLLLLNVEFIYPFIFVYLIMIANMVEEVRSERIDYSKVIITTFAIGIIIGALYDTPRFIRELFLLLVFIVIYKKTRKEYFLVSVILLYGIINVHFMNLDYLFVSKSLVADYNDMISDIYKNDSSFYRVSYDTNDIFDNLLLNNQYIISKYNIPYLYNEVYNYDGLYVYKTNYALPFGYSMNNVMNYDDYEKLDILSKKEAILKNIIIDHKSNNNYISSVNKLDIDLEDLINGYELTGTYLNKIYLISFNSNGVSRVCANGICNSYEGNSYIVISGINTSKLLLFSDDTKKIEDTEVYFIDPVNLENISKNINKFNISTIRNRYIEGDININDDASYFVISIPYKTDYKVILDDKEISYEKANNDYVGFKISKGEHNIKISYKNHLSGLIIALSVTGVISLVLVIYFQNKRRL